MKQIKLTRDLFALVDDDDFDWLNQWSWTAGYTVSKRVGKLWYAYRRQVINGVNRRISMHRFILNILDKPEILGEHKDNNGLNNQKFNLRTANKTENACNAAKRVDNKTGFKGVCYLKNRNKYWARIQYKNKQISLGLYKTPEEAFAVRNKAADEIHKEFARYA